MYYVHVTLILERLHWLPINYSFILKTATLVFKFLHSGSPCFFGSSLSLSSCSYRTRDSHPDCQYLTFHPFHSSLKKLAKHIGLCFSLIILIFGMIKYKVQHLLRASEKSSKQTRLLNPIRHGLPH